MNYDVKATGIRICELRVKNNYTQSFIAKKLNIELNHYKRIESGRRPCTIDNLIVLMEIYNVTLDYLVLGRSAISNRIYIKSELEDTIRKLSLLNDTI